ncbi:MAG: GspE/PulE family protein [Syntrophobacteraceae bacterium]
MEADRTDSAAYGRKVPKRVTGEAPKATSGDPSREPGAKIAKLLIEEGTLTQEQFEYARRVRSKLATPRSLTQVLQDLGFVTPTQLREILTVKRLSLRIGELLVELGAITQDQLEKALSIQRDCTEKRRLGDILIETHLIDERELNEMLSCQLGIPNIEPKIPDLNKDLLSKVSPHYVATNRFVPLSQSNGKVTVAFADPLNSKDLEAAEMVFGPGIIPAICTQSAISEIATYLERRQVSITQSAVDDRTVIGVVESLVQDALRLNASDIHIEPMSGKLRVRFRVDGVMIHFNDYCLDLAPSITNRLKILAKADIAEKRRHQGGRVLFQSPESGESIDMRVSFYVTIWGEKIVLRILNHKGLFLRLNEVGMQPKMLDRFCFDALDIPTGVILITGPTGSGKTTTLYSCLNYLDKPDTNIVTVEDPVEYVLDGIAQCSVDPKINLTFEESLRHIVRQDPDVIVVGEIRDQFSAETCIQASLTGHKVLTTFHTEDSIGGLIRLLNMNIEAFLISSTVVCVVAQRLLRRVCPDCAEPYTPTPTELHRLGYSMSDIRGAAFKMGRGCGACLHTGYKGRVGVFELLVLNELVKDAILGRKTSYDIRRISVETSGLVTLLEDGMMKAMKGETSLAEVLRHLPRVSKPRAPHELSRLLGV